MKTTDQLNKHVDMLNDLTGDMYTLDIYRGYNLVIDNPEGTESAGNLGTNQRLTAKEMLIYISGLINGIRYYNDYRRPYPNQYNRYKAEIIDAVREELEAGNAVVYARIGNGGDGLNIELTQDPDDIARFTDELNGLDFDGRVKRADICTDIRECNLYSLYNQDSSVYQLSDASGLVYQIVL